MGESIASIVFLAAMSVWLGGVVFFSFFTAPVIFERLPREQAADLISVIFPRYYNLGYVCGFLMLAAGAYPLLERPALGLVWITWALALVAAALTVHAGRVVMPRVKRLRLTAASSAGTPEHGENRDLYNRAHQLSVTLNSLVLVILVVEVVLYGYRVRDLLVV